MIKRIKITEGQFRKLIRENDELNHQLQGLHDYLKSGDKDYIELAFTIAESLGISEDVLLEPFKELFEFLKKYNEISSEVLNKEGFFEIINLESLYLTNNKLTDLPTSFALLTNFTNLTHLSLENNNLTDLPASVASLTNLTYLDLSNNNLTDLPVSVVSLTNLKYLHLLNNQLTKQEQNRIESLLPNCSCYF